MTVLNKIFTAKNCESFKYSPLKTSNLTKFHCFHRVHGAPSAEKVYFPSLKFLAKLYKLWGEWVKIVFTVVTAKLLKTRTFYVSYSSNFSFKQHFLKLNFVNLIMLWYLKHQDFLVHFVYIVENIVFFIGESCESKTEPLKPHILH